MNVIGKIVALLLSVGLIFTVAAILRGRIDGATALAVTCILLALAITAWAATNRQRKRNHP